MTAQHIDDNGEHIEKLDQRLRDLKATFANLNRTDDLDDILNTIHFPGWTTLQQIFFVNTLLDGVQHSADHAARQREALHEGVRLIAEEAAS
jgi:hypothetical protein